MKIKLKNSASIMRLLTAGLLMYVMLCGGDCSELTNDPVPVPDELVGSWKLVLQTGALQDICPDEVVNFQASRVALLTCPNSQQISRDYSAENNILRYIATEIEYDIVFSNNQQTLELNGRNVSRNLTYQKQTAGAVTLVSGNSDAVHSSDKPEGVEK